MCKACHNCIRILMMIFNFIFVLCGLGLFGMGLYLYLWTFFKSMGSDGMSMVIVFYIIMGVGAFTLVVGACGCCGAYHESPCLLGTYFILLLLIFAAEIAAGVLVVLYRDKMKSEIGKKFEKGAKELSGNQDMTNHWMHGAQKMLYCCGNKGPEEYSKEKLPKSCCPEEICENREPFTKGCSTAWDEFISTKWMIIAGILLGIALIELLGLIFSMCLCCTARSIYYDMVETRA